MSSSLAQPSRRFLLGSAILTVAGAEAARAQAAAGPGLTLVSLPVRVFKVPLSGNENLEGWVIALVPQTPDEVELISESLIVDLFSGGEKVSTRTHHGPSVRALSTKLGVPARSLDGGPPPAGHWPILLRVRCAEPSSLKVDRMRVALTVTDASGAKRADTLEMPIEVYAQKTKLIFPFKGRGLVMQAGVNNGGHRNRSGAYAIDACGLNDAWSIYAPEGGNAPSAYRGWGRPLLAPADGVVVRARADRPDQPDTDNSDPKYYAPEHPNGGDPGNHVVIDHTNGEFSMIAHFQAGSVDVQAGQQVRQGEVIGKLGNSGDSTGPHVHYQLQTGPDWQYADGLPCRFENVSQTKLDRGTFFNAN